MGLRRIDADAELLLLTAAAAVVGTVPIVFGLADTTAAVAEDDDDLDDLSRARSRSLSLLRSDLSLRFSSRRCWSSYFLLSLADAEDDDEAVGSNCAGPIVFDVAPADNIDDFSLAGLLLLCLLLPLLLLLLFSFLSRLSGRLELLMLPPPIRSPGFSDADDADV